MKRRMYDLRGAERLLPLLRSIANEITDRNDRLAQMQERLAVVQRGVRSSELLRERANLEADMSIQRRELRRAQAELSRLGCAIDEDRPPLRILIPGADGNLESGFAWDGAADHITVPTTRAA